MARGPYRTVFRIDEVGAAARMRDLAHVHERGKLVGLGVNHGDLVRLVGGHQEVTLGGVPTPSCRKRAEPISVVVRLLISV